ncbi:universal stress protein [Flagellimonas pacifica]|uniref:Nucleotide-binding universal stress protein, UspA family n=1 Tax=Flagellimonas pacifica TaxID=1247520 RepID=A0A285N020_9FLAO|nr:universal stress protein [Allomuricauda parva]SNZ01376.1 Nucleotide-binding universal stress protein, UspA family [Allomuricauda parva]
MKIVLAIDGSDFSKVAIDQLAGMPLPPNTEIHIINILENPMLATPGMVPLGGSLGSHYEEALSGARRSAEGFVADAARALKETNGKLSLTTAVVNGLPKSTILEEAETFGADLIVIGSQGHGAFSRFLLGSVSQSVAIHATCSVLIARKKE